MTKSYIIAVLILVISVLWIGSGFLVPADEESSQPEIAASKDQGALMKVRVIESRAQDYQKNIRVNGRSRASKNITLSAEADGQILEILVGEGETVTKGDEIIKIDIRERNERVRESRELVKQKQIEYNAARKLIKQGYSSDVRLAQTRSELESAKAALTRAQIDLNKTTISAPFDGVLGVRNVDVGDYVSVGDPISSMVDLDPLEVTIFVNEKEVIQIQKGDTAKIRFANGQVTDGVITFISPAADEKSRTFQVDIAFANPNNALPAGLTAQVSIAVKDRRAHKISPAILTLNDIGDVGVKIVTADNTIKFIPIQVIADAPGHMWIAGLPEVVKLVTVGQDFVVDGQDVETTMVEQ